MSVVYGIEKFKLWMKDFSDYYVLIGGGACSILFDQNDENFRQTKDLDIVVLTDKADRRFAASFWSFIESGGYKCGGRNDEGVKYYRFTLPIERIGGGYPEMIELFAKHPDFELENEDSEITPLPFDDSISSLSAIMLDKGYYSFLCSGIVLVGEMPIIDTLHIIPLKMRAHIDLNDRSESGQRVNDKDLKKHRGDVLRLSELLVPSDRLELQGEMGKDASRFLLDLQIYSQTLTRFADRLRVQEIREFLGSVYL